MALESYGGALAGERGEFEFTSAGLTFTVTAVPIYAADGVVESALVVVRDITQLCGADLDPQRWQRPPSIRRRIARRLPLGCRGRGRPS
jgi:DNA mismatch repair protein MutH